MSYVFARYFDAAGRELPIPAGPGNTAALARALLAGPVFCTLADMPADLRQALPSISPNVMLPFTRKGIDPFSQRFEVTLRGEGTVRGLGGLRVASDDCETTVRNLFVAGDAASREPVAGALSGGGNINSAWALSSGLWSGQAAAQRARSEGRRSTARAQPAGQAALRPLRQAAAVDRRAAVAVVQRAMLAYDRNVFRTAAGSAASLAELDAAWRELSDHAHTPAQGNSTADATARLRLRETAALLASARWSVASSLQRPETRGMHWRSDAPQADPALAHRIVTGGLQALWHRAEAVALDAAEATA
jgi:succinate dehydrogenase/fumarate reductase flavoprotein subunit